ncbi:MAG: hypothetical protein NTY96_06255 [Bacteroidetes bacterium]|nr:hypothetical protein [Bacteroidota bacterium]
MKTKIVIISLFLMLGLGTSIIPQQASAQGGPVSFQVFYDELSPYGTWVLSPDYGYVWVPNVAPGFTPYATNGYWIFTNEGWTWVSNYSWGWAPFHYGRWYNDPNYGPMWVPDNEWGPGWVTWRRSEGYYGWAPIGPGVSINIAYSSGYDVPYNQWTFVHDRDFGRRNINSYYVKSSNNVTIINNSTVIYNTHIDKSRNVTYNSGPERTEVEKRAGKKFTPVAIKESSRPGQTMNKNQLQIYRPQVQKNISDGHKPAPSKVESMDKLKPSGQRPAETPAPKGNPPAKQQPPQQPPQHNPQPAKQQPPQQPPQHNPQPNTTHNRPNSNRHNSLLSRTHNRPNSNRHNSRLSRTHNRPSSNRHNSLLSTTHNRPNSNRHNSLLSTTHNRPNSNRLNSRLSTTHNRPSSNRLNSRLSTTHNRPNSNHHNRRKINHPKVRERIRIRINYFSLVYKI